MEGIPTEVSRGKKKTQETCRKEKFRRIGRMKRNENVNLGNKSNTKSSTKSQFQSLRGKHLGNAECLFYYEDHLVVKLMQGKFFINIHVFWKELGKNVIGTTILTVTNVRDKIFVLRMNLFPTYLG